MKIVMLSYHNLPKGPELKPGDVHEFDVEEAERLISVKGARPLNTDEMQAEEKTAASTESKANAKSSAKAAAEKKGPGFGQK